MLENSESFSNKKTISIKRRNILYDIRETRLVKVFFFSISFSIYNALLWSLSLLYYTIRFTLEYEVTFFMYYKKNMQYYVFENQFLGERAHSDIHGRKYELCIGRSLSVHAFDFHDGPQNWIVALLFLVTGSHMLFKWTFYFFLLTTFKLFQMCVIFFFVGEWKIVEGQ